MHEQMGTQREKAGRHFTLAFHLDIVARLGFQTTRNASTVFYAQDLFSPKTFLCRLFRTVEAHFPGDGTQRTPVHDVTVGGALWYFMWVS